MAVIRKDLGTVTAYAYAVSKGYTGTEAEFAELMASYAEVAEEAAQSASDAENAAARAEQSATAAAGSASAAAQSAASIEGDAQIASQKAAEAQTAAGQAVTAKEAAQTAQQGAETAATNAGQSASTATAKASEAATSASNAAQSKTDAEAAAARAEQAAATLTVDSALSDTSVNPVENRVITAEVTQVKNALSEIEEKTRNLNYSKMGRWGNAVDGKIYSRGNNYYGMESFIPVTAGDEYTISYNNITSNDAIYMSFMFVNDEGAVINRTGYSAKNPRVTIAPTGATKFNLHFYSSSEIFITDKTYVQIELGEIQTPYVPPVSAIDYVLRSDINEYPTYLFSSVIGGIIDNAEAYFEHAYNDENNLVYDSQHGLFSLQTTSDNEGEEGHPAIVCSQFVQAMTKYITWENSRYVKDINHVGQYCFTSDGNNQDTQDGEPYNYSYYQYENGVPYDANDIPSYDYMKSSEFYRYALNHSWAYEIKDRYPQLRPGDVIFSIDEESSFFKQITHCAFCVYTGFDNKYVILLESNHFSYKDKTNVGVGIRCAPLSSNKYGARFPLHELPHIAKVVEHGKPFATESTQQYNSTTLAYMKHESGFYTVVIRGTIPYANVPQIGVLYNGDTSRTYYRLMCNGNVHVCFFYAPTDFSLLTFAIDTGSAVDIEKATLVKGYVPLT